MLGYTEITDAENIGGARNVLGFLSALADFSVIPAPDKLQHSSLQLSNPVILQKTVQSEF